jgi:hypothetical protein
VQTALLFFAASTALAGFLLNLGPLLCLLGLLLLQLLLFFLGANCTTLAAASAALSGFYLLLSAAGTPLAAASARGSLARRWRSGRRQQARDAEPREKLLQALFLHDLVLLQVFSRLGRVCAESFPTLIQSLSDKRVRVKAHQRPACIFMTA